MMHDGIFKMWSDGGSGICLYTSVDGIHWAFAGKTDFPWPGEGTVFTDGDDECLGYLYFQDKNGLFLIWLNDSLHAYRSPARLTKHECDTQNNIIWD